MRIQHHSLSASWFAIPESDPVDPEYEAEVRQSTERAEREYQRARDRLARAETRLVAALRKQARKKEIRQLRELVELRRTEFAEYQRLMAAPALPADKQIRHRTGLDDHLELGEYKCEHPKNVAPGPVVRSYVRKSA